MIIGCVNKVLQIIFKLGNVPFFITKITNIKLFRLFRTFSDSFFFVHFWINCDVFVESIDKVIDVFRLGRGSFSAYKSLRTPVSWQLRPADQVSIALPGRWVSQLARRAFASGESERSAWSYSICVSLDDWRIQYQGSSGWDTCGGRIHRTLLHAHI